MDAQRHAALPAELRASEEEQRDFPGSKSIKPDFVLQDLQGFALAVIENKLDDPQKALPKLRLKYSRLLNPRFLYEFPGGSVWDFFLAVLGVKKIPTTRERIESGFETYLQLYNFTIEQTDALRKIKDAFVANLSSQGRIDLDAIFANPIYARLIGSFEEINAKFDGQLREVVDNMRASFKTAA
jgi:hypothetical protein